MIYTGKLFVLSAPSGAGKSSLIKAVLSDSRVENLVYATSHTTRAPREGETDGVDYYFAPLETFREMAERGDFLEWTKTFENYYGTSRVVIEEKLAMGYRVITDVDVVGAKAIKESFPAAKLIFVITPTYAVLKERLQGRHTESAAGKELRLKRTVEEIAQRDLYDYLIVNDNFAKAKEELVAIVNGGEGRPIAGQEEFWARFF
ncbi:MAG: guanylate kinase [Deltaproteobacteria bacterium]|jgi:guanylate kinase|nr:guanylate kinase [Deltaproteobacteria bacterium]